MADDAPSRGRGRGRDPGIDASRGRGRPRDPGIDARVLEATRALLADRGFDATTVQSIAERSGVHASAIYRRWPTRTDIIEQAVGSGFGPSPATPTGDLRRDLRRLVRELAATLGAPAARAAMPALLATYQASGRSGAPETWLAVTVRPRFLDILLAAPDGAVDPDVDPDDVFDMILGAVMARVLVPTVAERDRPLERVVELALRLLQPNPAAVTLDPAAEPRRHP